VRRRSHERAVSSSWLVDGDGVMLVGDDPATAALAPDRRPHRGARTRGDGLWSDGGEPFPLGPIGDVTRSISGSLADGFAYQLQLGPSGWSVGVCGACGIDIAYGPSVPVGGRWVSTYLLPGDAREVAVDLPFWAVDDPLVGQTVLAVEHDSRGRRGSLTFSDGDDEHRRYEVIVYPD
jgi:hypothetical protein